MPIHDWTRVSAGVYHAMHVGFVAALARVLNNGVLPADYYALVEPVAACPDAAFTRENLRDPLRAEGFDVSSLVDGHDPSSEWDECRGTEGGATSMLRPAEGATSACAPESAILTLKRRRIVIRHATDDEVVALLEIVSPGNKDAAGPMRALVDKAVAALQQGYHLLLIDLFPPGPADPRGLHDRVWRELEAGRFEPPASKPLTLAAYRSAGGVTAYVEPVAVGQPLPDMPLLLDPDHYVNVPLESTYHAAYQGVPRRWRQVIEGESPIT